MEIAVLGKPEFTLGFRISGIRRVFDVEEPLKAVSRIDELMHNEEIGIIIMDEKTIEGLDERTRETVESSVKPVTVIVSAESGAQEALRKTIIKSIGVDLWSK